jgi:hypothetical protein
MKKMDIHLSDHSLINDNQQQTIMTISLYHKYLLLYNSHQPKCALYVYESNQVTL